MTVNCVASSFCVKWSLFSYPITNESLTNITSHSPLPCTVEDGEFEVSAEMLIHGDLDDEQTMEEVEALETAEEVEEEVTSLQQVTEEGGGKEGEEGVGEGRE